MVSTLLIAEDISWEIKGASRKEAERIITLDNSFVRWNKKNNKGAAMNKIIKNLSVLVLVFGAVAFIMGIVFLYEGASKELFLTTIMKQENIKLSDLGVTGSKANEVIDNQETA